MMIGVLQKISSISFHAVRVSVFILFVVDTAVMRADFGNESVSLSDWKALSIKELRASLERFYADGEFNSKKIVVEEDGDYLMPRLKLDAAIMVLDTSGSMRSPETGIIDQVVVDRLLVFLLSMPDVSRIVLLDTDGKLIVDWSKEKDAVDPQWTKKLVLSIVNSVANYRHYSESDWDLGVVKAIKIARGLPRELGAEIFLFGDEYASNFWLWLRALKKQNELPTINVVQAHETLLGLGKRTQFKTASDFDTYAKYLTKLAGGTFYKFVGPHYSRSWETVVLVNLVRLHPGESWIVSEDPSKIERWNETLKREFKIDRDFLLAEDALTKVGSGAIRLELSSTVLHDGSVSCILQRDHLDGSESKDYKALLQLKFVDSWRVEDWELTFDHEQ